MQNTMQNTMQNKKTRRPSYYRMINAHIRFAERNGAEICNLGKGMDGRTGIFSTSSKGGIETVWDAKRKCYTHQFTDDFC